MKSRRHGAYFALALLSGTISPALCADGVSRISGPITSGPAYVGPDLGGGCDIGFEIEQDVQTRPLLMFFRKDPECDRRFPSMAQVVATVGALLDAASQDGQDLRKIRTVNPTAIIQKEWVQNLVDCTVGPNDGAASSAAAVDARLESCDVAPELKALFAAHGLAIRFASGEKAFTFDCGKLEDYKHYFDPAWLAKYQGRHCDASVATEWWFKASPL